MGVKHHANPSGHKSIWHGQGSGGVISCWATSSRRLPWGKAKASPPTLGGEGASQPSRTSSLPMVRGRYHCKMWSYSFLPCRVDHVVGVLVGVGSKVNNLCHPSLWPLPLPPANATSVAPVAEHVFKTFRGHAFVERGHLIGQVVAQVFHFDLSWRQFLRCRHCKLPGQTGTWQIYICCSRTRCCYSPRCNFSRLSPRPNPGNHIPSSCYLHIFALRNTQW